MSIRQHLEKPKVKQPVINIPPPDPEVEYSDLLAEFRLILDSCGRFQVDKLLSEVKAELFKTKEQDIAYFFVPTRHFRPVEELKILPLLRKKFTQKLSRLGALFVKYGQDNTQGEPFMRVHIRKKQGKYYIGFHERVNSEERVYVDIYSGSVQVEGTEVQRFDEKSFSFERLEKAMAIAWDHPIYIQF